MTRALLVSLFILVNEVYATPQSLIAKSTSAATTPFSVVLGGKTYVNKVR